MGIREQALSKSRMWQAKKSKPSSYDAPSSTGLDTSYSVQKTIQGVESKT
jgi:hypothetical protein